MKIEFEIDDVTRDQVADAMANSLLNRWSADEGYGGLSELGDKLARAVEDRIKQVADGLVRERFDAVIADRINAAVDAVLADGWYETDGYGGRTGERHDLKARIGKALTEPRKDVGGYNRKPSILDQRIDKSLESMMDREFKDVIEKAKAELRARLDTSVMKTVADTVKSALGLK